MTLPVSSYEELLARVRSLTSETIQLRREITSSLCDHPVLGSVSLSTETDCDYHIKNHASLPRKTSTDEDLITSCAADLHTGLENPSRLSDKKEDKFDDEFKEVDEKLTSPETSVGKNAFHPKGWTADGFGLWRSGPSSLNLDQPSNNYTLHQDLTTSMNYNANEPQSFLSSSKRIYSHQQLGAKVEMVYSLLSMLDTNNQEDMSKTFLAMSSSPESCHAMRQSGCLPLLIQLIHSSELNKEVRERAAEALHNIVHAQTDEKRRRREVRVLKLLQQVREYCDELRNGNTQDSLPIQESDKHPINAIGTLMKFSFDAEHRQAICILGGLHAISELIQVDYEAHGNINEDSLCITLRRYAGMSLTNLTFGDCKNKALLCSFNKFMRALVDQLKSFCEDLRQVIASVLRNLSWRADYESKQALRDVGAVTGLTVSAMEAKKESTLKSILSALWNLSAHCSLNKIDICSVPGALAFLVKTLRYKSSSNTLAIVENAGGILRNISSHIAVREDYRQILRDNNCFEILLEQLKSPSLTIVSNACGTLWNLSARCSEDQKRLWEMGATSMLRSLIQSKHKMISMGSSAALKNLLAANPNENLLTHLDSTAKSLGLQNLPTLFVRKKRALEQELNISLAETCENLDTIESPSHAQAEEKKGNGPRRSDSRDSVQSTHSDSTYERINHITIKNEEKLLENKNLTLHDSLDEKTTPRKLEEQKLMRRYKTSMIPTPTFKKLNQDRINEKTREQSIVEDSANETAGMAGSDSKEKMKKGIPKQRSVVIRVNEVSHEQHSFLNLISKEECSVKNKEIESHQVENVENYAASNSFLNFKQIPKKTNSGREKEYEKNEKSLRNSRNYSNISTESAEKLITKEIRKNANEIAQTEVSANGNQISYDDLLNSLKDQPESCFQIHDNLTPVNGSQEQSSHKDCNLHINETLPSPNLKLVNSKEFSEANPKVAPIEANKMQDVKENQTDLLSRKPEKEGGNESNERIQGREASVVLSLKPDYQACQNGKVTDGSALPAADEKPEFLQSSANPVKMVHLSGTAEAKQSEITVAEEEKDELEKRSIDDLKSSSQGILPKFKVGSPITDSRGLQMEANKICREIRKQQDFEMGCSLTSEVSLISCSSFLDTGDYSLFESSTEPIDFDDSENLLFGKASSKFKGLLYRKPTTSSLTAECVSLPSLGSLKNEQIEMLDLDSSILSVASITSEIADSHSKDLEAFNTYTKTYKVDPQAEFFEETLADATLISEDHTPNPDSLQNNCELIDEDNSLHFQENLPLDVDDFQESNADRMKKKLTPKEKRKTFQERYRTYTIRDFKVCKNTPSSTNCQGAEVDLKNDEGVSENSTRQKHEDADRSLEESKGQIEVGKQSFDLTSMTFYDDTRYKTFVTTKNKERDFTPSFAADSKSLNDLLSIGPSERKELVVNAKLVAFSLKTAFQDCEITSDSEPEETYMGNDLEIDTATYSKSYRNRPLGNCGSQGLQNVQYSVIQCEKPVGNENPEEEEEEEEEEERKGARISKPGEKPGKLEEISKGIRGRRKPLYSLPPRSSQKTNSSPSGSPRMSQAVMDTRKTYSHAGATLTLYREGTFTKEDEPAMKKNEIKSTRTIPVLTRNPEFKNFSPTRTFTRNKPVLPPGKRAEENQVSRIGRPVSTYSRSGEKRPESSHRRPFSAETVSRTGGDGATASRRPASTVLSSPKMRNSSSNQNVRGGSPGSSQLKNPALQSSKSQSDASINLVATKDKVSPVGKSKTSKKEVTSKIANLWRKVEETKQKNKNSKDNRVWISSEKNTKTLEEVLVIEQEEILDIPTRKIVHSLTCQALSDGASADYSSQVKNPKNSHEFSNFGNTEDRRGRIERRNIISAVVPPYNYNPPASEKVASSKIKQVDTFHEGSLKITTV